MSPRRIVIVISDLGAGGAQRVVSNLAGVWVRAGMKVSVVTFSEAHADLVRLPERVDRRSLGGYSPSSGLFSAVWSNLRRLRFLRKAIREAAPDVVIAFLGATNIMTIVATAGLRVRTVVCERNDPARQHLGRGWEFLRRRLYRYADLVTSNSESALATLKDYVPSEQLSFVPNPIAPPESIKPATFPFRVVLTVARLTPQKAIDCLLRGFARIAEVQSGWGLVIAGSGDQEPSLKALAADLGISSRVTWLGHVASPWEYFAAAEIFVLPSRYEGMPNALLEAMHAGVPPIISSAVKEAAGDLVVEGESGIVFETNDVDGLAGALSTLISDEHLRMSVASAARERMRGYGSEDALTAWNRAIGL